MAPYIPPASPPEHDLIHAATTWSVTMLGVVSVMALISVLVCVALSAPNLGLLDGIRDALDLFDNNRGARDVPPSDISKLMMKGRIELYRYPDLLAWYDEQAKLAGLLVVHPTNSTVTTEYVSVAR